MYCQKTSFAAGFNAVTQSKNLLQADSGEKVVQRLESEMHLAKHLKLHDSSMLRLTECLKCSPFVAFVGCALVVYFKIGGFCDQLSVLSDLAECHYPVLLHECFLLVCFFGGNSPHFSHVFLDIVQFIYSHNLCFKPSTVVLLPLKRRLELVDCQIKWSMWCFHGHMASIFV